MKFGILSLNLKIFCDNNFGNTSGRSLKHQSYDCSKETVRVGRQYMKVLDINPDLKLIGLSMMIRISVRLRQSWLIWLIYIRVLGV